MSYSSLKEKYKLWKELDIEQCAASKELSYLEKLVKTEFLSEQLCREHKDHCLYLNGFLVGLGLAKSKLEYCFELHRALGKIITAIKKESKHDRWISLSVKDINELTGIGMALSACLLEMLKEDERLEFDFDDDGKRWAPFKYKYKNPTQLKVAIKSTSMI